MPEDNQPNYTRDATPSEHSPFRKVRDVQKRIEEVETELAARRTELHDEEDTEASQESRAEIPKLEDELSSLQSIMRGEQYVASQAELPENEGPVEAREASPESSTGATLLGHVAAAGYGADKAFNAGLDLVGDVFVSMGASEGFVEAAKDFTESRTLFGFVDPEDLKPVDRTWATNLIEGTSQFLTTFALTRQVAGTAGLVGTARNVAAGASADFLAFEEGEARLSNLLADLDNPVLSNAVTDYLAADEDDGWFEGRMKNVVEGAGIGAVGDALVRTIRGIKAYRGAASEGLSKEIRVAQAKEAFLKNHDAVQPEKGSNLESTMQAKVDVDELAERAEKANAGPKGKQSANINTTTLPAEDDYVRMRINQGAEELIQKLGKDNPVTLENIATARASELAKLSGQTSDEVLSALQRSNESVQLAQARVVYTQMEISNVAARMNQLNRAAMKGDNDAYKDLLQLKGYFLDLLGSYGESGRRASQLLNIRRLFQGDAENAAETLKSLRAAMAKYKDTGALEQLDRLANDPEKLAAFVKDGAQSASGRLLMAHNTMWINSILSGPKTSFVNLLSNVVTTGHLVAKNFAGSVLTSDAKTRRAALAQATGLLTNVADAWAATRQAWTKGRNVLDPDTTISDVLEPELSTPLHFQNVGDSGFKKAWNKVATVWNTPTRFLMAQDEFFKQLNYRAASKSNLTYEALRRIEADPKSLDSVGGVGGFVEKEFENLIRADGQKYSKAAIEAEGMEELRKANNEGKISSDEEALEFLDNYIKTNYDGGATHLSRAAEAGDWYAYESTFTRPLDGPRYIDKFAKNLQLMSREVPPLQIIVPFVRTPTNILKYAMSNTLPIPWIKDTQLYKNYHSADPLMRAQAVGQMAVGWSITSGAAIAAANGNITGSGAFMTSDQKQRALDAGWKPYSVRVPTPDGFKYVSFERLEPLSTTFGMLADFAESLKFQDPNSEESGVEQFVTSFGVAMTENITNKSYLVGVQQAVDAIMDPERFAPQWLQRQASSYVPSFVGQMRSAGAFGDDRMRDVRNVWQAVVNRTPWSNHLEPRRDFFGEAVNYDYSLSPVASFSDEDFPDYKKKLASLNQGFGTPSNVRDGVDLYEYKNDQGQTAYNRWLEIRSEGLFGFDSDTLASRLEFEVFSLPEYDSYTRAKDPMVAEAVREDLVRKVQNTVSKFNREAFDQIREEFPELDDEVIRIEEEREEHLLKLPSSTTKNPKILFKINDA